MPAPLTLSYKISDDYGAVSAEPDFADPTVEGTSGRLRSLVPPPHVTLPLPAGPGGLGERRRQSTSRIIPGPAPR